MWQDDVPLGLSSLYVKCSSAEVCDSSSAYLIPTSCSWQVFSTPARWDWLVSEHHFSVLREISIFHLPDYYLSIHLWCVIFFHIFMHRGSLCICLCLFVWVRVCLCLCVCEPTWQCSSGILQNATYQLGSCFLPSTSHRQVPSVCLLCVSIIKTVPVWSTQTHFPVCHNYSQPCCQGSNWAEIF